jgi:cytochrome c biogenesis protein CcmG/thiol:disulfide interchange protein DsbE
LALLVILVALGIFMLTSGRDGGKFDGAENRVAAQYELQRLGGGEPVRSADFAGRAHLINLFASWCVPCRAEHPLLMDLQAQGVEIVGVAYKDEATDAAAFLRRMGDPYSVAGLDPDGAFGLEIGVTGVPETLVIGADGRVRASHRGPLTEEIVAQVILPALAAEGAAGQD